MHQNPELPLLRRRLEKRGINVVISGADGSGKTTLARQLVASLREAGLPAHYLHVYNWYNNLLFMPCVLLHNRFFRRAVLVMDRSIYDNLAVLTARSESRIVNVMSVVISCLYPSFDHAFYLYAPREEIASRRPEVDLDQHDQLISAYSRITRHSAHFPLASDSELFARVLSILGAARNEPALMNPRHPH